jgi:hypothetical protein
MGPNRVVSDHVMAQAASFQTDAEEFPVRSKAVGVGFVVNISGIAARLVAVIHNDFYMLSSITATCLCLRIKGHYQDDKVPKKR